MGGNGMKVEQPDYTTTTRFFEGNDKLLREAAASFTPGAKGVAYVDDKKRAHTRDDAVAVVSYLRSLQAGDEVGTENRSLSWTEIAGGIERTPKLSANEKKLYLSVVDELRDAAKKRR
jgi:hypothetical protein